MIYLTIIAVVVTLLPRLVYYIPVKSVVIAVTLQGLDIIKQKKDSFIKYLIDRSKIGVKEFKY